MAPGKAVILKPIRPNLGNEAEYYGRLLALIKAMDKSVAYWVSAEYRAKPPAMAMDATPADALRAVMTKLARRWIRQFDEVAQKMAERFATNAAGASDRGFMTELKRAGFAIPFKPSPDMRDALASVVNENVALIKSIPAKHLSDVEGSLMRSVQAGRDLKGMQDDLLSKYDITKKRAAFIARDQNNKATAVMTKARRLSLGITEAIWVHSGGGVHPRQSHLKAGAEKLRYDIAKGAYIDGEYIMPGELPNCRCTSRAVIPGYKED